ncbi:hypothetical protein [Enterobacter cloacae complex sp. 288G10]|uniref:hypothetical protein n=1 Tax=Enterobacter cloacae complex sp. 288G10 TaxID=3395859 RepID=UPI003CF1639B
MSEALTGVPGQTIACGIFYPFSVAYFGVVKPNLGLVMVSALMMLIMANCGKIYQHVPGCWYPAVIC